jgi:15-cis-phytoene synthase
MSLPPSLADAYAHCESVTRRQAANFYYGIRLLPRDKRRAMCASYAFARRVDDIGDGTLASQEKLQRLDAEAAALAEIGQTGRAGTAGEDPVMLALADASLRFSLPADALEELIEGVRMDVDGVTYETFDELVLYCRRVAGAIGRVCLAIFGLRADAGMPMARAEELADDLGVALQITNILRDVGEDAANGRVYLPAEDLRRFGVIEGSQSDRSGLPAVLAALADGTPAGGAGEAAGGERLAALMRFEAERARDWFERGIALAPLLDRRSAACVLAMAGIYRRLLERIEERPEEAMRRRMSLPAREKAWVAARGMLGGRAA